MQHNQYDFGIDCLMMSTQSLFLCCWEWVFAMTSVFSWQNSISYCPASFCTLKSNLPVTQTALDFLLLHSSPLKLKGHLLGGVLTRRSCKSSENHSTSASSALLVWAQTWITVILNGLPWKRTEIILSFLRFNPSTAFQTLLLTMTATPFLLKDFCPQ